MKYSTTRIENLFNKTKAFIGYLTAGDGGIQRTFMAAQALIAGGVNMLEIGVPFSDPVADGSVIQHAAARALNHGTTFADILWLIQEIRKISDIPLILFSYANPILALLKTHFFAAVTQAGIDGLLIVDCPLEENYFLHQIYFNYSILPIAIIAPTTSSLRTQQISQQSKGFIYYACRKGTTGIQNDLPEDFAEKIQQIKANNTLPVVVGFGIATKTMAKKVLHYADGVVVGSLFVDALAKGANAEQLKQLALSINPLLN